MLSNGHTMLHALSTTTISQLSAEIPPSSFTNVTRLLSIPLFDFLAEKDGETYVFAACARRKHGLDGKINPAYHLFTGNYLDNYTAALKGLAHMGYDLSTLHYCFLVCPVETGKDSVYYWGEFTDVRADWSWHSILHGRVGYLSIPVGKSRLAKYSVFGKWTWEETQNKLGL